MGKSIITDDMEHCIECGQTPAQTHHLFGGYSTGNRNFSDEDGLVIPLCYRHHTEMHNDPNKKLMRKWHRIGQWKYEENHTREEFRKRYGKSYL